MSVESVQLRVDDDQARQEILSWLAEEPALRGRIRVKTGTSPDATMAAELYLELVVPVVGSVTAFSLALAKVITAYLTERERQRRSDVTIRLSDRDGRPIAITVKRAKDAEALVFRVLGQEPPPDQGA